MLNRCGKCGSSDCGCPIDQNVEIQRLKRNIDEWVDRALYAQKYGKEQLDSLNELHQKACKELFELIDENKKLKQQLIDMKNSYEEKLEEERCHYQGPMGFNED